MRYIPSTTAYYLLCASLLVGLTGCQLEFDSVSSTPATPVVQPLEIHYGPFPKINYHVTWVQDGRTNVDGRSSLEAKSVGQNLAITYIVEERSNYGNKLNINTTRDGYQTRFLIDSLGNIRDAVRKNNRGTQSTDAANGSDLAPDHIVPIYLGRAVVTGGHIARSQTASGAQGSFHEEYVLSGMITYRGRRAARLDLVGFVQDSGRLFGGATRVAASGGYMVVDPENGSVLRYVLSGGPNSLITVEAE